MSKNYCKVDHKWCKYCKHCGCTYVSGFAKDLHEIKKCPIREARETVSLKQLLLITNLYDIMTAMIESHPKEKKNIIGYAEVYNELLTKKKGIRSNGMLRCTRDTYSDGTCVSIYGVYNHKEYAIEFVPWGKWLTMNVEKETLDIFSKEEICAAALYEMTYNGYSEEAVQNVKKQFVKALKNV